MRLHYLLAALALACLPVSLAAQFGSGTQVDTTGWAPAGVGVRGGYDNELQGWMTGGYVSIPLIRRGSIELSARVSHRDTPGTCFVPFHFREAAANVLTIDEIDPTGKIPEFKFCAVRVEPVA